MHKILLVNNGTRYLKELRELFEGTFLQVTLPEDINPEVVKNCDAIVLSGGRGSPVVKGDSKFQKEIELIKQAPKPILGICLGFEFIAWAFGGKLTPIGTTVRGVIDIKITKPEDPIFENATDPGTFQSHRWAVTEVPADLIVLAESETGIEVVRHSRLPIYGVQFHPEMSPDGSCGKVLARNFIDSLEPQAVSLPELARAWIKFLVVKTLRFSRGLSSPGESTAG